MIKTLLFATLFLMLISCNMQPEYRITIKSNNEFAGNIYLLKEIDKKITIVDSAVISDGLAILKGKVDYPDLYYISYNDSKDKLRLFVENSKIEIEYKTDSADFSTITGSQTHDLYAPFAKKIEYFDKKQKELYVEYQVQEAADNAVEMKKIEDQVSSIYEQQQEYTNTFVQDNLSSVVALYVIRWYLIYDLDYDKLFDFLTNIPESLKNTTIFSMLNDRLQILSKTKIGNLAPDFTMNNIDGNPVSLGSLKGKVVLIDFWASWCGPCRRANPEIVMLYEKYKNHNFEILGVSFDKNREKWLEAIKSDNLTWLHVSDLQGWNNAAGKIYGINSIPHSILIDDKGLILGNRMSFEELEQKLKQLFEH